MSAISVPAPERPGAVRDVAARLAVAAGGTLLLGALRIHRPSGYATLCPLRALTGIPCPVCGTTTALVRLGRGRVAGALAASPLAVVALVALVLFPAYAGRVRVPHRALPWLLTCAIAFAWTWQLARFGKLPF